MSKPLIIKLGGAALEDSIALDALLRVCATLHQGGQPLVLVHGGGSLVDSLLKQAGFTSQKLNGLRVTPLSQLPLVVGGLAGMANKQLVSAALQHQLPAVGLSLLDGGSVTAEPIEGLGQVGSPQPGDDTLLNTLLGANMVPVISSIAATVHSGELLNVNADDAAAALCQLLGGELLLLSDVPGVLDANGELLHELNVSDSQQLVAAGVIHGGMQVKVSAAQALAAKLGAAVRIASWRDAEALLEPAAPGTAILPA